MNPFCVHQAMHQYYPLKHLTIEGRVCHVLVEDLENLDGGAYQNKKKWILRVNSWAL